MNKKLIRLTESDLHRIVRQPVNKLLRESMEDGRFGLEDLDYDGFYMNRFLMAKKMEIDTKTHYLRKGSGCGNVSVYDFLNHEFVVSSYESESYDELLHDTTKAFREYRAAGGTEKLFHNHSVGDFVAGFYLEELNKYNKAHGEPQVPVNDAAIRKISPINSDLGALSNLNWSIFDMMNDDEDDKEFFD